MIITKLQGGLGNQLFQYSLGRFLAHKHQTPLKLDTSWYGVVPDRQYDLSVYAIAAPLATAPEAESLKNKFVPLAKRSYFKERFYHFDPAVLAAGPNVFLEGYWQSEKYFLPIADIIRHEITLKTPPQGMNKEILQQINETLAVSLHVRRGDYVSNSAANNYHGTSPLEYYKAAVDHIAKRVKNPHFYIFSDDPTWTRKNLLLDYPLTFVTGNDKAAQEDLRLMSQCRHFIIANSTFSWWGAWLSSSEGKTVIAPKEWFKDKSNTDKDLIPNDWLRL